MKLFDIFKRKTSKIGQPNPNKDEDEQYFTKDEILNYITKFGTNEFEIEKIKKKTETQDEIIKGHKCSIHGEAIDYAYSIESNGKKIENGIAGIRVSFVILKKCCSESSDELIRKLQEQ